MSVVLFLRASGAQEAEFTAVSLKVVGQLCEGLGVRVDQVIEFKAV